MTMMNRRRRQCAAPLFSDRRLRGSVGDRCVAAHRQTYPALAAAGVRLGPVRGEDGAGGARWPDLMNGGSSPMRGEKHEGRGALREHHVASESEGRGDPPLPQVEAVRRGSA